ncbi:hypothetical protein [Roseivirga pacifica]|uniref:hypothetical protein n=1 Tax=Roseivirga pacifica TaxID=1267423 RepID=UPI00227B1FC6|nr:hypothetical protein [Roseivirga pacifica]
MNKIDLTKYSPPQTYLLLNPKDYSIKECFKYCVMDLILKKVLSIELVENYSESLNTSFTYKYIKKGKHFNSYETNLYETHFTSVFTDETDQIQARYFAKAVMESSLKRISNLRNDILKIEPIVNRLNPSWAFWWNRNLKLDSTGKKQANSIRQILNTIESEIQHLASTDKEKALSKLKSLGNNFLLIPGFDQNMLEDFETLFKEIDKDSARSDGYGIGCSYWIGCDTGNTLDFSDFADVGCSSGCSSGCGGGCSGCSGCGGCS